MDFPPFYENYTIKIVVIGLCIYIYIHIFSEKYMYIICFQVGGVSSMPGASTTPCCESACE